MTNSTPKFTKETHEEMWNRREQEFRSINGVDGLIEWIALEFQPQEVFTPAILAAWAEEQGYEK